MIFDHLFNRFEKWYNSIAHKEHPFFMLPLYLFLNALGKLSPREYITFYFLYYFFNFTQHFLVTIIFMHSVNLYKLITILNSLSIKY